MSIYKSQSVGGKIKLLYILCAFHTDGSSLSLIALLKGVKKLGNIEIVVISGHRRDLEWKGILDEMGIKSYLVPMVFHSYPPNKSLMDRLKYPYRMLKRYARWFISLKKVEKIARKENVSIIHTNVGPVHIGHVVARRLGIPHIWHIREYGDKDFNIREYPSTEAFRKYLAQDITISITEDIRKHNLLLNNPNAHVIYNGVRKYEDVHYDAEKEKYFLCASSVSRSKGQDDAIRAFAIFYKSHPDWRLIILGKLCGNDYIDELKQIIKENDLGKAVTFEGHKTNVTDYMRKAKALIVASHYEGFGRMTAEASFAGCMVIGRRTGGTLEIMEKTGGIMFSNNEELLSGMEKVAVMSEEEYKSEVLRSQRIAQQNFSEEAYINNVINIYKGLTAGDSLH